MKRKGTITIRVLVLLVMTLGLFGCDPSTYRFNYDELAETVVSVEIIDYANDNQKKFKTWVPNQSDKLVALDMKNITILASLEESQVEDFVNELCSIALLHTYYAYDSPKGIAIKMNYANGDFEIIQCAYQSFAGYIGRFSCDGEVVEFHACFQSYSDYERLLLTFFEYVLTE